MSQVEEPTRSGRGGVRPGAGRKPAGYIATSRSDLSYARALVVALMRDETQPMELRARCALAVIGGRDGVRRPSREALSQGQVGA